MAQKVVIELEIEEGKAIQDLDKVKKGFQKVVDEQGKQKKATQETKEETAELGNKLDAVTGGAVTKFRALTGGIKKSTTSLKAMRVALIATGIGAFVVAIGALVANLQNSEAGFNRVQKLLKQFGVIAGNVTDIFYSLGTALFGLVTGDFVLMNQAFEEATQRIKNFGDETKREIALQGELADKQADLVKLERQLVVDRAEANRKRAELLEKAADKENFTAAQRIEFLKEAGKIEEEITNSEIEAAKLRLEIREQENTLSESSAEDLDEESRLKAALIDLETQRLTKQKLVTAQITSALREEQAEVKALTTARQQDFKEIKTQSEEINTLLEGQVTKRTKLQLDGDKDVANSLRNLGVYKKQVAKTEVKLEKLTTDQKLSIAQNAFGNLAAIAGEQSAVGKAAAIAQTTISTYQGAQESYKALAGIPVVGPALGALAAAAAIAGGLAQVRAITAVQQPSFGGQKTIATRSRPSTAAAPPQPPSFNVVGASGTSQLAQAIGDQQQQPVKAYVVSDEVTSQQALDRNIVESASLG